VLSVVLGNGDRHVCPLELARGILAEVGDLPGLIGISPEALRHRGLSEVKSGSVLAALELARRLARSQVPDRKPLATPGAAARYLVLRYALPTQEVFGALYLDARNRLIGEEEIFRGTIARTAVEPCQVLRSAILSGAAGIVAFHTHPSGDPSPSMEDLDFTKQLSKACAALNLVLHDHLILGSARRWVSLKRRVTW
jgi:DNA repair protein RadC